MNKINYKIQKPKIKAWHIIFLLFIVLVLSGASFLKEKISPSTKLADKEVKEYQGKRLSSINDLREVSISGTQYIDVDNYKLEITGLVSNPQSLSYKEILDMPKYSKVVDIKCVVGWSAKILWEGVLMKDLLEKADVKPEAKVVIFYAKDGFTTSLPLDYIINNDIILADKINDVVLPASKGFPFQLVAEQKWGYKWIKWITKIELSDNVDYRGTYESAGYSNDADITGPKLED